MDIRASYSTICETELLLKLLPLYRIDDPISCKFWQRGVNDTYQVHCSQSVYSLRVYRHRLRTKSDIDFEVSALNYLNDHGANVARPIAKHAGGFVTEIQAPEGVRYVMVTTHANGTEPDYGNVENGRLFGESVAELHNLSDDFETEYARPKLDIENLLDVPLNIIRPFLDTKSEDLEFLENTATNLREAVSKVGPSNLDFGFCHGDCHGCNVHCSNGSITHFDFDCCGFGFRVFELATFKWGIKGDTNEKELWSKFLEGYQSKRKIGNDDFNVIDTFVVIRHIWWMALIMGNARDFGNQVTTDEFIDRQIRKIRKLLK
jgi:Ser/Thr protein kinase RdoA (MazF antagonist)